MAPEKPMRVSLGDVLDEPAGLADELGLLDALERNESRDDVVARSLAACSVSPTLPTSGSVNTACGSDSLFIRSRASWKAFANATFASH